MTKANYAACFRHTLKSEGGWSNHPKDPGGATMRGVTQRVYDGYRKRSARPLRSVRQIEDHELQAIYKKQYWDAVRGDDLPAGVDLAVYDFAVNSGVSRAAKYLQTVLRCNRIDGHIGEATLAMLEEANRIDVVKQLCDLRLKFLQGLDTWGVFGKGWSKRVKDVKETALRMAMSIRPPAPEEPQTPALQPDVEPAPKAEPEPQDEARESWIDKLTNYGQGVAGVVATIVAAISSPYGVATIALLGVFGFAAWRIYKRDQRRDLA